MSTKKRMSVFLCIGVLLCPFILSSNESGRKDAPEEIIITAKPDTSKPEQSYAQTTVITRQQIENQNPDNIAEVLDSVPGLHIVNYGGPAQSAFASIRGSSPEQVLVLINGKRVNSPQGGGVDLASIDPQHIRKIEVIRGAASARYGENALAGVINIITRGNEAGGVNGTAFFSYGSFNTVRGGGSVNMEAFEAGGSGKAGHDEGRKLKGSISVSGMHTEGGYSYKNSQAERDNTDGASGQIACKLAYKPIPIFGVSLSGFGSWSEEGAPGLPEFPTPSARMEDSFIKVALAGNVKLPAAEVSANTHFQWQTRNYSDSQFYLGKIDDTHKNTAITGNLEITRRQLLGKAGWAEMYADINMRHDTLNSTALVHSGESINGEGTVKRFSISGSAGGEAALLPREKYGKAHIILYPSVRYDWNTTEFIPKDKTRSAGYGSGTLGIAFPLESFSLKGNIGTSYRVPSFDDLFWPSTAFAVGNPDLKAEKAYTGDAGITGRIGSWAQFDAAVFYHRVKNLIAWTAGAQGQWRPRNIGQADIPGMEAEARILKFFSSFQSHGEFVVNTTVINPINNTENSVNKGNILPYKPRLTVNSVLSAEHWQGHSLWLEGRFLSGRYITAANTKYLPRYFVLNAGGSCQVAKGLKISLSVKNILNKEYVDKRNYPVPGIQATIKGQYRFGKENE